MLDVFAVFCDQCRREFAEFFSQLRDNLGTDEVLDGLFLFRFGVDVDIKLSRNVSAWLFDYSWEWVTVLIDVPRTHPPQYRGLLQVQ